MFSTLKLRLLLGLYIFLILSIPVGAYLVSQQRTVVKSSASEEKAKPTIKPSIKPKPTSAAAPKTTTSELLNLLESQVPSPSPSSSASEPASPTIATSFGPTLSLKVSLEGRPADNQSSKLFVGIVEGSLSTNPKFILNFTVDLPKDGIYTNLSLAGLSVGTKYTALLKGDAQIAASSEFTMSPNISNLNEGQAINLITGDLNEDNTINSSDYSIVQKGLGSTSQSSNWNTLADFNKDGVINTFDLAIVTKNLGQVGASGTWTSPLPQTATPSGSIRLPVGQALDGSTSGYWLWIPH